MKSGWLLIPAALFGFAAVFTIAGAIAETDPSLMLLPTVHIIMIGVAVYLILLFETWLVMKRPVTTELVLIVGWSILACSEINALYANGVYAAGTAWFFLALIIVLAVISLVCYLLYYRLNKVIAFYDGMIPLAMVAVVTAVINLTIVL